LIGKLAVNELSFANPTAHNKRGVLINGLTRMGLKGTFLIQRLTYFIKSAIGCEKVIPRSDSKLLDLHVWLGVETLIKSLRLVTLLKVRDELGIRLSNPYPN